MSEQLVDGDDACADARILHGFWRQERSGLFPECSGGDEIATRLRLLRLPDQRFDLGGVGEYVTFGTGEGGWIQW